MKKRNILPVLLLAVMPAIAQETYQNATLATEDLAGTARYIGMGGAMEALGADISTINTNPAGIGLFRRSSISASAGYISQQDAENFDWCKKSSMAFNQIGFVYSHPSSENSYVNFGFNYHMNRNFNHILSASASMSGASSNKLSYAKGYEGIFGLDINNNNEIVGVGNAFNQLDYLNYNALLDSEDGVYRYTDGSAFNFNRGTKGYIGEYDFNISGNINDRVYLGLTMGIKDVNYKNYSDYEETLVGAGFVHYKDERRIDGEGFDIKAGVIFRPVEYSPFRIGLYVHTPTWYDLTTKNYTVIENLSSVGLFDDGSSEEVYDYKLYTPWRFGVSAGTTFGDFLALGATYEYSDYSNLDSRIKTGEAYNWYTDRYYDESSSDNVMNAHTEKTLKGVHTLKVGAELKADEHFAVRLGYNYLSSMYDKNGYMDGTLDSPGCYYASTTDYTNWKSTNRITAGVGYSVENWNFDLSYQYSSTKGEFYPFMSYYAPAGDPNVSDNIAPWVDVENNRHQVLLTIGYRF